MNTIDSKEITSETQVVVIGAGVIGCSIAYQLANRGIAVTVIDAKGVATGTTSATLGLVWVSRKDPVEYMELNLLSSKLHAELARTYDEDVELIQNGGLATYIDDANYMKQLRIAEMLNAANPIHATQNLSPQQARQMEPNLSLDILGALYSPHDGQINPMRLAFNLAHNAKKHGAQFLTHCQVLKILHNDEGVMGVETSSGVIRANVVAVAAGVSSSKLVAPLGIHIPMVFERGQILLTEPVRWKLAYPTGLSRQTTRGNILLGVTFEANQTVNLTTSEGAKKLASDSIRRFPVLKNVKIIRHFAGIRPLPKDGLPYLGAIKRLPGLFVATSHSGITLAPVHGKVISELIIDNHTDVPIEAYNPERYCAEPLIIH